jgi:TetR/AcrR family transcriptional regulator, tetracycline repressor protein
MRPCTLYSCQVPPEKLTRAAVAERALRIADAEGLEAVTIRRLATELGVTPMALYWHFKNKDELMLGISDHVMAGVRATRTAGDPWQKQLRAMVEVLVAAMRVHPCLPALLPLVDKDGSPSFMRASNDALELLTGAGLGLQEAFWVASYLLHGSIALVAGQPGCPSTMTTVEAAEWRRQKRLTMEKLPPDQYPMLISYARTLEREPDIDRYYAFGITMLIAGVEAIAGQHATAGGKPRQHTPRARKASAR